MALASQSAESARLDSSQSRARVRQSGAELIQVEPSRVVQREASAAWIPYFHSMQSITMLSELLSNCTKQHNKNPNKTYWLAQSAQTYWGYTAALASPANHLNFAHCKNPFPIIISLIAPHYIDFPLNRRDQEIKFRPESIRPPENQHGSQWVRQRVCVHQIRSFASGAFCKYS